MYFSTYLLQDQAKWDFSRLEQMNAQAFCLAHISIALALPLFIHIRVFHSFPGSQYAGITQHHAARLKRRIHPWEADSAPPASRLILTHWTMMTTCGLGWTCGNVSRLRLQQTIWNIFVYTVFTCIYNMFVVAVLVVRLNNCPQVI